MVPFLENCLGTDLVLLIEGCKFAFISCVYLWCMQCHVNQMTFDAPTINTTFEDKFGTLQLRMADSVAITLYLKNCALFEKLFRNRPRPHS